MGDDAIKDFENGLVSYSTLSLPAFVGNFFSVRIILKKKAFEIKLFPFSCTLFPGLYYGFLVLSIGNAGYCN